VELHPGLNIIIGPNGSGKTNFLEFLDIVLSLRHFEIPTQASGEFSFKLKNSKENYRYEWEKKIILSEHSKKPINNFSEYLFKDDFKIEVENVGFTSILESELHWNHIFLILYIRYELSQKIKNLSKTLSFTANLFDKIPVLAIEPLVSEGVIQIIQDTFFPQVMMRVNKKVSDKEDIEKSDSFKQIEINLKKFSPISSLRIMPNPELKEFQPENYTLGFRVDYINFEFKIQEEWLNWNQLSDGTKRLFYIITEVTLNEGMCLIEEPEIGVHPNQYKKILTFLKEQAKNKQIIITTHAPKTLDILEDDELDRIILTRYEKDLGTKMRHLSNEEQEHAVKFMKEESFFLSDFWTLTSFFDEEAEVI